jgi:hypothetical protein
MRLQTKAKAKEARRSVRYRTYDHRERIMEAESKAAELKAAGPRAEMAAEAMPAAPPRRLYVEIGMSNNMAESLPKTAVTKQPRRRTQKKRAGGPKPK